MNFFARLSGFDLTFYNSMEASKFWLGICNIWFVLGILLCALASSYLLMFTTGSMPLAIVVGLVVFILFLAVQAALISIPGFHCEMPDIEVKERIIVPLVRSVLISSMVLIFSFPVLLSVQQLILQQNIVDMEAAKTKQGIKVESVVFDVLSIEKGTEPSIFPNKYTTLTEGTHRGMILISVPELVQYFAGFYKSLWGVCLTLFLIVLSVAGPFILRDFIFLKNYETVAYRENKRAVLAMFEVLADSVRSNEVILNSLAHPFERKLSVYEEAKGKEEILDQAEKADFVARFFESPIESKPV